MGDNVGSYGYYWDFFRSHFYYLDCIFRDIVFSFSFIVLLNNGSIGLCLSILLLYLLSFQKKLAVKPHYLNGRAHDGAGVSLLG